MFSSSDSSSVINWHLVIDLEETLYLVECMLEFFKYEDAELFMKNMYNMLDKKNKEQTADSDLSISY